MGMGALLLLATSASLFLLGSVPTSSNNNNNNRGLLYSPQEEMSKNGSNSNNNSNSMPYLNCKPLLLLSCVGCSKDSPPPRCCNALRMALSHHINNTRRGAQITTRGSSGGPVSSASGGVSNGTRNSSGGVSGNSSSVSGEVDCFCSQIRANLVDRSTYLPILHACGIPQQETTLLSHC